MTVSIMQPYLYPYIGYWQLIHASDVFVILDDVNYIRRGWINRNFLKDGRFTLPVVDASQNKMIKDIDIIPEATDRLMKRIEHCYKNAPYYNDVINVIDRRPMTTLSHYIRSSIFGICNYLGIETNIIQTSSIFGKDLSGPDRIIDICHQLGADSYLNAPGGKDLYNNDQFKQNGIDLFFIETRSDHKLSIVDLLMTKSKEDIITELNEFDITCYTK